MWELRPREGRDTHRQCTRPLDFNISTCQLHFFKTAACLGIMSSLILRLHLEKTKGFSAPHPTRKEQKAFYLKEHSKRYGFSHKHDCSEPQKSPQHAAFTTQLGFSFNNHYSKHWGHNFDSYSSRFTMHSNSSGSSTVLP